MANTLAQPRGNTACQKPSFRKKWATMYDYMLIAMHRKFVIADYAQTASHQNHPINAWGIQMAGNPRLYQSLCQLAHAQTSC